MRCLALLLLLLTTWHAFAQRSDQDPEAFRQAYLEVLETVMCDDPTSIVQYQADLPLDNSIDFPGFGLNGKIRMSGLNRFENDADYVQLRNDEDCESIVYYSLMTNQITFPPS